MLFAFLPLPTNWRNIHFITPNYTPPSDSALGGSATCGESWLTDTSPLGEASGKLRDFMIESM